jgi:hypothetical protein
MSHQYIGVNYPDRSVQPDIGVVVVTFLILPGPLQMSRRQFSGSRYVEYRYCTFWTNLIAREYQYDIYPWASQSQLNKAHRRHFYHFFDFETI